MDLPLVSVIMLAYNHEAYISQALEGILMQKTNFVFEIVIGVDCSTDKTRDFIQKYAEVYPQIIRPLFQSVNIGMMNNYLITQKSCKGKYIASCEADDYWIDNNKLQRQADFLEENPSFSGVCHELAIKIENAPNETLQLYSNLSDEYSFTTNDLINSSVNCPIGTASLMFRFSALIDDLDEEFATLPFGDKPAECIISKYGPIKYLPEIMGVYRKHSGGFTSGFHWNTFERDYEQFYEYIDKKLNYSQSALIKDQLKKIYLISAHQYYRMNNYKFLRVTFKKITPLLSFQDLIDVSVVKLYLKFVLSYFPFKYR